MAALISFYDWLAKQKKLRTPLGEFARVVARDPGFPRDVASLDALVEYFRASEYFKALPGGSAQIIAVGRLAYRSYERAHGAAPHA
jgi:uncharacterized protein YozE (UPF0346 family)